MQGAAPRAPHLPPPQAPPRGRIPLRLSLPGCGCLRISRRRALRLEDLGPFPHAPAPAWDRNASCGLALASLQPINTAGPTAGGTDFPCPAQSQGRVQGRSGQLTREPGAPGHSAEGSGEASWMYLSSALKDERIAGTKGTGYAKARKVAWGEIARIVSPSIEFTGNCQGRGLEEEQGPVQAGPCEGQACRVLSRGLPRPGYLLLRKSTLAWCPICTGRGCRDLGEEAAGRVHGAKVAAVGMERGGRTGEFPSEVQGFMAFRKRVDWPAFPKQKQEG